VVEKGAARRGSRTRAGLFHIDVNADLWGAVEIGRDTEREMGARRARIAALAENIVEDCSEDEGWVEGKMDGVCFVCGSSN